MGNEINSPRQARVACRKVFEKGGDGRRLCLKNVTACSKANKADASEFVFTNNAGKEVTKQSFKGCLRYAPKAARKGMSLRGEEGDAPKTKKKRKKSSRRSSKKGTPARESSKRDRISRKKGAQKKPEKIERFIRGKNGQREPNPRSCANTDRSVVTQMHSKLDFVHGTEFVDQMTMGMHMSKCSELEAGSEDCGFCLQAVNECMRAAVFGNRFALYKADGTVEALSFITEDANDCIDHWRALKRDEGSHIGLSRVKLSSDDIDAAVKEVFVEFSTRRTSVLIERGGHDLICQQDAKKPSEWQCHEGGKSVMVAPKGTFDIDIGRDDTENPLSSSLGFLLSALTSVDLERASGAQSVALSLITAMQADPKLDIAWVYESAKAKERRPRDVNEVRAAIRGEGRFKKGSVQFDLGVGKIFMGNRIAGDLSDVVKAEGLKDDPKKIDIAISDGRRTIILKDVR